MVTINRSKGSQKPIDERSGLDFYQAGFEIEIIIGIIFQIMP